ncbi:MAG: HIT-like protein [candidate division TA06 bacterium ADurb.Bin131]|uniref:HIT-like protein n=1 Tax=candidate division TA06 bacterium ADurb.Bin131 TaxID=1852827 RepID=A0A1V6CDM3_UNCT6|nr:MAG: HIT-like protein [candidate division TA06 bacterium ADurb.Bin131]
MDCVFCRISQDKTPAKKIYQDNDIIAFHDINPQAPVHVLIISRRHLTNLLDVNSQDESLIGRMLVVATQVAKKLNVSETGFRIVINTNKDAGQSIDHLHIHLLGGRKMQWPPG